MARVAKYNKEALLADYHTGEYTQRDLARKHKVSNGTVASLTKGLLKKTEQLVSKKVEVIQESKALTEQELIAVDDVVDFKSKLIKDIELFTNKAVRKANGLLDETETGNDFKAIVEGVDKLSILTNVNDRHAKPTNIQQNNQNNSALTDEQIQLRIKELSH